MTSSRGDEGAADAAARLRDAAKVIGWGLLLYGVVACVGIKLQAKTVGALALQMVIAEWGSGRLGVAWSDPEADVPTYGVLAKRAGRGAAIGLGAAILAVGLALGTGALHAYANSPAPGQLGIGVAAATFLAARDELLLRGVVLRAFRKLCPTVVLLLVCGVASVAAEYGLLEVGAEPSPARLLVAGLLGVGFASLWLADRGGWLALGAHATWTVATGTLIRGGLFDLRSSLTAWAGGDLGVPGSVATLVVLVPVVAAGAAWAIRRERARRDQTPLRSSK